MVKRGRPKGIKNKSTKAKTQEPAIAPAETPAVAEVVTTNG